MELDQAVNSSFGGNVYDKKSYHINSICRIAYTAVLHYSYKIPCRDIAMAMGTTRGNVKHRLWKHRNMYEFDKNYKQKFNNIMADIAKCNDTHCPSRLRCSRFTAAGSEYQVYHNFHRDEDEVNCLMFKDNGL